MIYIVIGLTCAIYELSLGGKILELTLVPAFYLFLFSCWIYCIWCIWAYFRTLRNHYRTPDVDEDVDNFIINLQELRSKKIYPRPMWDSPLLSNNVRKNASFRDYSITTLV